MCEIDLKSITLFDKDLFDELNFMIVIDSNNNLIDIVSKREILKMIKIYYSATHICGMDKEGKLLKYDI